mgnify:CR=1 FL=1
MEADFTKPPEGTGGTTTSAGVSGDSGGGGRGLASPTPNLTPQQQTERFDTMVQSEMDRMPTGATGFQQQDFENYVNVRQPMSERTGIMGKVGGAVDTAAGFMLPDSQDKAIRQSAASKLINKSYGSKAEYDALMNTVNLPPKGDTPDSGELITDITDAKKITFDAPTAEAFDAERTEALEEARKVTPLFDKDSTVGRVSESFLSGLSDKEKGEPVKTSKKLPDGSYETSTSTKQELFDQNAAKIQRDAMNPIRSAERMRMEIGGGDTSQMSGAEREEAQRKQEDAARRAAAFEQQRDNTERQRAEDSKGKDRGSYGAQPSAFEEGGAMNCVIATHGLSTGGFSRLEKAKAEIWCAKTYHGKWYGEAFRRGYRAAGQRCIDSGKAREHYQEFKDFVAYGRGVKKGFGLAITYYLRTVQFFITGLFISE